MASPTTPPTTIPAIAPSERPLLEDGAGDEVEAAATAVVEDTDDDNVLVRVLLVALAVAVLEGSVSPVGSLPPGTTI